MHAASTGHLEEHNGHSVIQDALAEDERVQLRVDAHLAQHRYRRHSVCCREQCAKQQPFLRTADTLAHERRIARLCPLLHLLRVRRTATTFGLSVLMPLNAPAEAR